MTIKEIDEILKGTFTDEADRMYWEKKREEMLRKEIIAKEHEEYFRKYAVYDR